MASAIDQVLSAAECLGVDLCCEAIAAAELCASCACQLPDRLPDSVYSWVQANPHGRTPTRSSWWFRPSVGCARRASCASFGRSQETGLSGWLKWTIFYRDWDGPAPGAHPLCLLDQAQRSPAGRRSGYETRSAASRNDGTQERVGEVA